jgi:hypothetical protein
MTALSARAAPTAEARSSRVCGAGTSPSMAEAARRVTKGARGIKTSATRFRGLNAGTDWTRLADGPTEGARTVSSSSSSSSSLSASAPPAAWSSASLPPFLPPASSIASPCSRASALAVSEGALPSENEHFTLSSEQCKHRSAGFPPAAPPVDLGSG